MRNFKYLFDLKPVEFRANDMREPTTKEIILGGAILLLGIAAILCLINAQARYERASPKQQDVDAQVTQSLLVKTHNTTANP